MAYKRLTRQDLHVLVWSKPMRDLASEIGLSYDGLKKICVKYDIPTPPLGHWQRIAAGRTVATPPLATGRAEQVIDIRVADPEPELPATEQARRDALLQREGEAGFRIQVPAGSPPYHPVADRVQRVLQACKPDDYGCLRCYEPALPFVRVTPQGFDRALALIDAIARAVERRGFSWRPDPGDGADAGALVLIEDVGLKVGVYETVERRRHTPTPDERRKAKMQPWFRTPAYDFLSTNQVSIRQSEHKIYVKDTPHLRVEDRLHELMAILISQAFDARESQRRGEVAAAAKAARVARGAEIQRLQAVQAAALERLRASAVDWKAAQDLRAFIDAVESLPAPVPGGNDDRAAWLSWARDQAESLDPLARTFANVTNVDFEALARLKALMRV